MLQVGATGINQPTKKPIIAGGTEKTFVCMTATSLFLFMHHTKDAVPQDLSYR
jgi:hypothetical protein